MFEAHFGFHHTPFGKDLLPEQLYSSTAFRELKERLRYAIERVRIMAVTGEVGAGKSTTLRAVTAQLPTALYRFMYLPKPINSPRDLFRELLQVLRIDPPWMAADARLRLREALETMKRDGLTPVLIQDEAQALTGATLEELRMLTSFDMDTRGNRIKENGVQRWAYDSANVLISIDGNAVTTDASGNMTAKPVAEYELR